MRNGIEILSKRTALYLAGLAIIMLTSFQPVLANPEAIDEGSRVVVRACGFTSGDLIDIYVWDPTVGPYGDWVFAGTVVARGSDGCIYFTHSNTSDTRYQTGGRIRMVNPKKQEESTATTIEKKTGWW